MGCSPKNVQGERGGCKGAFIQTTVGTEAGDDCSDPHTFRILGDLRLEVECFPAGPLPPHTQGHTGPGGSTLSYQTLAPWWLEFSPKPPFYNEKVSSFPGKLHCLLSHSSFVLGAVRCQEAGGHDGDTLPNGRVSQAARPAPCGFPLEACVHLRLPLHHDPTGACNQGLGQEPSLWPGAPST